MPYKDKAQLRDYQNDWKKKRREQWLAANGPCAWCGSADDLEVDHIDPSQKVTHRIWTYSDERRAAELAKCQVLCKRCNQFKNETLLLRFAYHGSATMYKRHGCRCDRCRTYKRMDARRYRVGKVAEAQPR